jgi:hypothetical protein
MFDAAQAALLELIFCPYCLNGLKVPLNPGPKIISACATTLA